jgi:hypothetical protein
MKLIGRGVLLPLIIATFGAGPARLPGEPPAQLYLLADWRVDVSRSGEFEAALKELLTVMTEQGFPSAMDTYAMEDGHYYATLALAGHAGVDLLAAAWADLEKKAGRERLAAIRTRIDACSVERSLQTWAFRPDLSYLPRPERLKPEEISYVTWDIVWIIPGREAEFEACNREWIALSGAKGALDPFLTYKGAIGSRMQAYVWLEYGRSAADYAAAEDGFWTAMGEEGAALAKRTRAVIRTRESRTGSYRRDLSYALQTIRR